MIVKTISTKVETREQQKGFLLAGLMADDTKNPEPVLGDIKRQILARLFIIQEMESELLSYCPMKKPPYGIIDNAIQELRQAWVSSGNKSEQKKIEKMAERLKFALTLEPAEEIVSLQPSVELSTEQVQQEKEVALNIEEIFL